MEAMTSAIARPASTSPPTVLSRMSRPSMLGDCSMAASWGMMCSYLVVLVEEFCAVWPSICPTMVMMCTVARAVRSVMEP